MIKPEHWAWFREWGIKRLFRFGCVGLTAFCIDAFTSWLLLKSMPEIPAVMGGYALASVFHYTFSKGWTFSDKRKSTLAKVLAYAGVNLTTLVVNSSLSVVFLQAFHGNILLAKACALPPTSLMGFVLLRLFVFKHSSDALMGAVKDEP